jgi:hypothetical protein
MGAVQEKDVVQLLLEHKSVYALEPKGKRNSGLDPLFLPKLS